MTSTMVACLRDSHPILSCIVKVRYGIFRDSTQDLEFAIISYLIIVIVLYTKICIVRLILLTASRLQ